MTFFLRLGLEPVQDISRDGQPVLCFQSQLFMWHPDADFDIFF